MNSKEYSAAGKTFHWLIVILVGLEFLVAALMPEVERNLANPPSIVMIHFSIGIVILAVMIARLGWRLTQRMPTAPPSTPGWQDLAAKATHYGLYASLVVMPFAGWAWASSLGWPVSFFGIVTLSALVPQSHAIVTVAADLHVLLAALIIGLIGFHTLGALYHWIFLKDGVMERMLPKYFSRYFLKR